VPLPADPASLIEAARSGDRRALARLITIAEEGRPGAAEVLGMAHRSRTDAYRIGITGAPGAGKSTLTDGLIGALRAPGDQVAVLAVDPTSPFSGGAVLGDRVRMQDHVGDPGVYIRSMASRGHLGGLSVAAPKALCILESMGFVHLLIETVGVGQDEVEIAEAADTTIVVVTPGWGDAIQAAKAGILEIGDVFVVNKADRPGVGDTVRDLQGMLALAEHPPWQPPIVTTVAERGEGVSEVIEAVAAHREHLGRDGLEARRRRRRRSELEGALTAVLRRRAADRADDPAHQAVVDDVLDGGSDPWSAAEALLADDL
jgi:LAO/AO transport system kinase